LVVLYGQFMMHGQRNIKFVLYCSSQDNLDAYVHLEEMKYLLFLGQLKQGYQKRALQF